METVRAFVRQHATGMTVVAALAFAVLLSALPLPAALRLFELLRSDDPLDAFAAQVFKRSDSPSGSAQAGGAASAEASEELEKSEVIPAAAKERRRWVPPSRDKYDRLSKLVGAAPRPIVNPCVEGSPENCGRHALDRFFAGLADAEEGLDGSIVRVVHFGDSLIASDKITDMVRLRLQERFGSAGRGFILLTRLNRFARGFRFGKGTSGWDLDVITQGKLKDDLFGYSGASFTAAKDGESSTFEVGPNRYVEIFYLRHPAGGRLEIWADDRKLTEVDTKGPSETSIEGLTLPAGAKEMKLVSRTKGVRIFGVAMEADVPGIIYESLGLPGATAEVWMIPNEASFKQQLLQRNPALIVTMLGGNDALMLSKGRTTLEEIEEHTRAFVKRFRDAAPDADCLIVSPMDSARTSVGGQIVSKPEVPKILAIQEQIAATEQCAFWNMWESMGSTGSLERWFKAGMINPDMIHPQGYGGDLLGEMMVTSLMEAYDAWAGAGPSQQIARIDPVRIEAAPKAPAPVRPSEPGPLDPFYAKLAALERGEVERVAVAVLGAGHVARHVFTDHLREGLGGRFSNRGRGYASSGRGARVLDREGVKRSLSGRYEVHDGRAVGEDEMGWFGMSGIRTELSRGASFSYAPCGGDCPRDGKSVFELFMLRAPGMGTAVIEVSGVGKETVSAPSGGDPELWSKRWVTSASRPKIEVTARGSGSVELFGVSHEIERRGVVVDPIGYPGVTPAMALRWDPGIVLGMLNKRRADLLVMFYGEAEGESEQIDESAYQRDFARWVRRLRAGTDEAPCLVIGPAVGQKRDRDEWREWPAAAKVEAAQRVVAEAEGCGFWVPAAEVEDRAKLLATVRERRVVSEAGLIELAARFSRAVLRGYDAYRDRGAATAARTDN